MIVKNGQRMAVSLVLHGNLTLEVCLPYDVASLFLEANTRFVFQARLGADAAITGQDIVDGLVNAILASQRVEQQSYRSCMDLLRLTEKYSAKRLEAACQKALTYTASPSYKSNKNFLAAGQDKCEQEFQASDTATTQNKHAITRGADYYRR